MASLHIKIKFDITRVLRHLRVLRKSVKANNKSDYRCSRKATDLDECKESGNIRRFRFVTKTASWHQTAVTFRADATRLITRRLYSDALLCCVSKHITGCHITRVIFFNVLHY